MPLEAKMVCLMGEMPFSKGWKLFKTDTGVFQPTRRKKTPSMVKGQELNDKAKEAQSRSKMYGLLAEALGRA